MGAEIGLCTSSRERLGTCYAEPTQRRVRIAGVERASSGGWRGSRESLGLGPPPPGRQGTTPRRPLATSTRNASDTHQKVVYGKQQEEGGGKGRLTVAGGIEKDWGAVCLQLLPASHDSFELTYGTPADHLRCAVAQRFGRTDPRNLSLAATTYSGHSNSYDYRPS
jgi:hypothetical protein